MKIRKKKNKERKKVRKHGEKEKERWPANLGNKETRHKEKRKD